MVDITWENELMFIGEYKLFKFFKTYIKAKSTIKQ